MRDYAFFVSSYVNDVTGAFGWIGRFFTVRVLGVLGVIFGIGADCVNVEPCYGF